MNKGILIYERNHYELNKWFAKKIIEEAKILDLDIKLVFSDELIHEDINFIINRTHDYLITEYYTSNNIKCFNNELVCLLGNNKKLMYEYFNNNDIRIIKTTNEIIEYPFILKEIKGYSGTGVYKVNNELEYQNIISTIKDDYIIQEYSNNTFDIRVYIINNKIIKAIKRENTTSFKANVKQGGKASIYTLNNSELELVNKVLSKLDCDFVGIDLMYDNNNQVCINEIEDVVGTRSLYELTNIDIVREFLNKCIKKYMDNI